VEVGDGNMTLHFGFITPEDQDGAYGFSQASPTLAGATYVYEFTVPDEGTHVYRNTYNTSSWDLSGPGIVGLSWDYDREYVLFAQNYDWLNGNTFPGTAQRISGWFLDTIRIQDSTVDPTTGETVVSIIDEPRLSYKGSNSDPLNPPVAYDCPAYGGPLTGRYGTGCVVNGIHTNNGHNIAAATYNPGVPVWIEGHADASGASINGVHWVKKDSLTTFRIPKIGTSGSSGGTGGFVHIWRLHKSNPAYPSWQNNGASGAYLRFNYGESNLIHLFNGDYNAQHFSIHGHTFNVVADNGYTVPTSRSETSISVPALNSADVVVQANNPNRVGTWELSNDIQHNSGVALNTPWPGAALNSNGIATYVDYTGFAQGVLVLDNDGNVNLLSSLPPACTAPATVLVLLDNLGNPYPAAGGNYVILSGSATFPTNPLTGESYGTVTQYSWALVSSPDGDDTAVSFTTEEEASTYVTGLTANGTYVFTFTASGQNSEQSGAQTVSCTSTVLVVVCTNATECGQSTNSVNNLPVSWVASAVDNVRLGVTTSGSTESSKRQATSSDAGTDVTIPDAIGQVTFTYYTATHLQEQGSFTVEEFYSTNPLLSGDVTQDPNPLRPLYQDPRSPTDPLVFHRWSNEGANTDFWFDIDPSSDSNRSDWSFAIKQAVFDGRVETFGYVLSANIGSGVAQGDLPPVGQKVVYPLYQGSSNAGLSPTVHHDVYFLILEASDADFCAEFNCVYTPSFSLIPISADYLNPVTSNPVGGTSYVNQNIRQRTDTGTFAHQRATSFVFTVDPLPLPITSYDPANPPNTAYSPLKLVSWSFQNSDGVRETRQVIANMPYVYWGSIDVQDYDVGQDPDWANFNAAIRTEGTMLLVEQPDPASSETSCDPLVPGFPAFPFVSDSGYDLADYWQSGEQSWDTPGPPGCSGDTVNVWQRQQGGQLLAVPDFYNMLVVFKTHRAAYDGEVVPYFSITDTSDFWDALFHGVPWTPALNSLGRGGDVPYVSTYQQWGNGIAGEGFLGFQDAVVGTTPVVNSWTPFWQVSNLYWNCGSFQTFVVPVEQTTYASGPVRVPSYGNFFEDDFIGRPNDCNAEDGWDPSSPSEYLEIFCPYDYYATGQYYGTLQGIKSWVFSADYEDGEACGPVGALETYCNFPIVDRFLESSVWKSDCLGQPHCTVDIAQIVALLTPAELQMFTDCEDEGYSLIQVVSDCGYSNTESLVASMVVSDFTALFETPNLDCVDIEVNYGLQTCHVFPLSYGLQSAVCPSFVVDSAGSSFTRAALVPGLVSRGSLIETNNPPSQLLSATTSASIYNAHVPYVFRPAASFDPEDWVPEYSATTVSKPVVQGVWSLMWQPSDDLPVLLAVRPSVGTDVEPYLPGDNSVYGDFPPTETAEADNSCTDCAWEAVYVDGTINGSPWWVGQYDSFFGEDEHRNVFRLSEPTEPSLEPQAIKYVLLECNDQEFAAKFGARYEPNLPTSIASSAVWWEEPEADEAGNYLPDVVTNALNSFTFSDIPGAVGVKGAEPNPLYTPFKLFSFESRYVVCNMPFVAWGTGEGQQLVIQTSTCNDQIRLDLGLSDANTSMGGPPGCEDQDLPLQLFAGAQVISVANNQVTVKIHRAIGTDNSTYYYFTIWDSSDPIQASYYGIPVTAKLADVEDLDSVWYFGNGISCAGCNPYNFQDPILGSFSPVRAVTNLLWNCDGVWAGGDLFAPSNRAGTACAGSDDVNCDPFPLRADLKGVECDSYVLTKTENGIAYYDEIAGLVDGSNVFETYSPLGAVPGVRAQEVVNAPIILALDLDQ